MTHKEMARDFGRQMAVKCLAETANTALNRQALCAAFFCFADTISRNTKNATRLALTAKDSFNHHAAELKLLSYEDRK